MKTFTSIYRILLIATLATLAACTQSLSIQTKSDVPTPLITQLPLNMGVYYEDQFRNYIYTENSEDRPNWSIDSGASQVDLFNQVLPSMFISVVPVDGLTAAESSNIDAILVPHIDEMQFAMPYETKTEFYEVWIKYKLNLHDKNGDLIAEWPVTGYGKSSIEFLKSRDEGLQTAINSAFRDIGAKFSLNFSRVTEVRQWLASKPGLCNSTTNIC